MFLLLTYQTLWREEISIDTCGVMALLEKEWKLLHFYSASIEAERYLNSLIVFFDPLGQPTFTAGRDNCFCTCRPYVLPHFSKSSKTKLSENNVLYWRDCESGRMDHWWNLSCLFFLDIKLIISLMTLHLWPIIHHIWLMTDDLWLLIYDLCIMIADIWLLAYEYWLFQNAFNKFTNLTKRWRNEKYFQSCFSWRQHCFFLSLNFLLYLRISRLKKRL